MASEDPKGAAKITQISIQSLVLITDKNRDAALRQAYQDYDLAQGTGMLIHKWWSCLPLHYTASISEIMQAQRKQLNTPPWQIPPVIVIPTTSHICEGIQYSQAKHPRATLTTAPAQANSAVDDIVHYASLRLGSQLCCIAPSRHAASRCAVKTEMDSILVTRQSGKRRNDTMRHNLRSP